MSLPNLLTLFRFVSAPIFLALFIGSGEEGFLRAWMTRETGLWLCLGVVLLSELSDVLDGMLARHLHQVTNFGKILDPYADSTFRLTCYFAFASHAHGRWIPIWMVMVLLYRDLLVTVVRNFGLQRGVYVHARASGKIKAIAQASVVMVVLFMAAMYSEGSVSLNAAGLAVHLRQVAAGSVGELAHSLMWLVTAVTAWSAWDYVWGNRHLFRPVEEAAAAPKAPPAQ